MSKKTKIIELLEQGTDIDDICTQLKVTKSYVYRVQREMDESKGDSTESDQTENTNTDGVVIDTTSGTGVGLEGDNENLEHKKNKGGADKSDKVGGVKKRKINTNKKSTNSTKVNNEQDESEHIGGVKSWIVNKWKGLLMTLILSILLIVGIMLSFMRKPVNQINQKPRFPMIH